MMSDPKAPNEAGPAEQTQAAPTAMPPPLPMAGRPAKASGLPKPYVALWGAAAVVSLGYLATAIVAPGIIGISGGPENERAIMAENAGSPSAGGSTHERSSDRELQDSLSRARMEIAKLRTEITSREQVQSPASRPVPIETLKTTAAPAPVAEITTEEPRLAQDSDALIPVAPPATANETSPATIINQKPVETTNVASNETAAPVESASPAPASVAAAAANAAEEKTIAKATLLNGTQETTPSAIETGSIRIPPPPVRGPERPRAVAEPTVQTAALQAPSVRKAALPDLTPANAAARPPAAAAAAKPVVFQPPVIERASEAQAGLGLRLARGASLEAIRLTWSLMNERHSAVLSGLQPRYVLVPGPSPSQPVYQLIAGPLNGAGEALQKCQDVSARGLPCEIGEYAGNAL